MSRRLMSSLAEFERNSILNQIEYTSVCHIWCFTWILIKSYAQLKCLYQWIFSCFILHTRQYPIKLCLLELWQSLPSDYMSPALTAPPPQHLVFERISINMTLHAFLPSAIALEERLCLYTCLSATHSVRRGCTILPQAETPGGRHRPGQLSPGQTRPPPEQTPPEQTPKDRPPWAEPSPPRQTPLSGDGHCSGRYASYWNAFLFNYVTGFLQNPVAWMRMSKTITTSYL